MTSTELTPHQYTPLHEPVPITEQNWSEGTVPLVSICCITYNHEKFIEECLEGFLMQETTFPVEILIHDDASTDRTADIIREYAAHYPQLFRPIYQTENQYSQGKKPNLMFNFPRAKGKYIALCEGDDYWTDIHKLQKQVDLLVTNDDLVGCCTNFRVIDENGLIVEEQGWGESRKFQRFDHIKVLEYYPPRTLTLVFHHDSLPFNIPKQPHLLLNGDRFLSALITLQGDIGFMDEVTGSYRVHNGGVWSGKTRLEKRQMQYNSIISMKKIFNDPEELQAIENRLYYTNQKLLIESLKEMKPAIFIRSIIGILHIRRSPFRPIIKAFKEALFNFNSPGSKR